MNTQSDAGDNKNIQLINSFKLLRKPFERPATMAIWSRLRWLRLDRRVAQLVQLIR